MNDDSEKVVNDLLEELTQLFQMTDQVLSEWTGEGNLQFPVLLGMMAVRLNWDEKQLREADPFVRKYVRNHPDWHVTRGAHGGIMRSADKQKKEADKVAKDLAKKQMKEAIEAAAAAVKAATDSSDEE
jgi:hypothetical protein